MIVQNDNTALIQAHPVWLGLGLAVGPADEGVALALRLVALARAERLSVDLRSTPRGPQSCI